MTIVERKNWFEFHGRRIDTDKRIEDVIDMGDKAIVVFYVNDYEMGDMMVGRNILAYDEDGNELWRVEDHGLRRRSERRAPDAFFDIRLDQEGRLWGGTPGVELMIDPETGKILDAEPRW